MGRGIAQKRKKVRNDKDRLKFSEVVGEKMSDIRRVNGLRFDENPNDATSTVYACLSQRHCPGMLLSLTENTIFTSRTSLQLVQVKGICKSDRIKWLFLLGIIQFPDNLEPGSSTGKVKDRTHMRKESCTGVILWKVAGEIL